MTDIKGSTSTNPDIDALQKEWDEVACPICMDHPHNAVLLICTSHEKGCRSYICDTSYRHSNCLDRFRKLRVDHSDNSSTQPILPFHENSSNETLRQMSSNTSSSEQFSLRPQVRRNSRETLEDMPRALDESNDSLQNRISDNQTERINLGEPGNRNTLEKNCFKCPLCRGTVMGWMIIKEARQYLNQKSRSCSHESCAFLGNYGELRRHARRVHPMVRPADVDPSRQRSWLHLEHQHDYGDILSAIRSAMPGAVMLGDHVIDDGDGLSQDRQLGDVRSPWWATLLLFHMMSNPTASRGEFSNLSRTWRRHRRSSGPRYLLGENLLGLQDYYDDADDGILMPRRRRRLRRSRSEDDRP